MVGKVGEYVSHPHQIFIQKMLKSHVFRGEEVFYKMCNHLLLSSCEVTLKSFGDVSTTIFMIFKSPNVRNHAGAEKDGQKVPLNQSKKRYLYVHHLMSVNYTRL